MAFKDFFEFEIKKLTYFLTNLLGKSGSEILEALELRDNTDLLINFKTKSEEEPEMLERFLTAKEVEENYKSFAKYCYTIALDFYEKNNDAAQFYAQLGREVENIGNKMFSLDFDTTIVNELNNLKSELKEKGIL
ncbi:hypothetical protein KRX57_09845 [Weeksellaceae bacterium TAE3-ERU29]|nr:hypothetical protein [Weeksellaceae bacterium TAE3-ERU29]